MSSRPAKPSFIQTIVGLLLIAISIAVILFGDRLFLGKQHVETQLQAIQTQLQQRFGGENRHVSLTHGGIAIEGWLPGQRQARIIDINLTVSEPSPEATSSWSLATRKAILLFEEQERGQLLLTLPDAISFSENGELQSTINFSTPVEYRFTTNASEIVHSFALPQQAVITSASGLVHNNKVTVSYDANPLIELRHSLEDNSNSSNYVFSNLSLDMEDGKNATAARVTNHVTESMNEDGVPTGKYLLNVNGLSIRTSDNALSKRYNIVADVDYTGQTPSFSLPGNADSKMVINALTLSSDDFSISAEGLLNSASNDPLPFGMVNIKLNNVPAILNNEFIPEFSRPTLADALERATEKPMESMGNATLSLSREKKGVFYVGNISFDALAASILASLFGIIPPPPADAIPLITEPDSKEFIMPELPTTPEISN